MAKKKKRNKNKNYKAVKRNFLLILWLLVVPFMIYAAVSYCLDRKPEAEIEKGGYKVLLDTKLSENMEVEEQTYKGYKVYFNSQYRIPNCVCYELTRDELKGNVPRYKKFLPDPNFKMTARTSDYTHSGYDRGHMAPSADMKWDKEAMREAFYMSNICPQDKALNRGDWKKLEEKVRDWAERDSVLLIVCGPVLSENMSFIGKSRNIAVPERYFKVLLAPAADKVRAIGFIFENDRTKRSLQEYAVSVDSVESLTGYDFFSALNDDLETAVEAKCNYNLWNNQ